MKWPGISWQEYWDKYVEYICLFALAVIAGGCVFVLFWGCSGPNTAAALAARQQAVQNCIVSGGHPRLGPGQTIICE